MCFDCLRRPPNVEGSLLADFTALLQAMYFHLRAPSKRTGRRVRRPCHHSRKRRVNGGIPPLPLEHTGGVFAPAKNVAEPALSKALTTGQNYRSIP